MKEINSPVGYLVRRPGEYSGRRGVGYDYVMAGNGLWVESEGPYLAARAQVGGGRVRGLAPMSPRLVLRNGRVPWHLFDLALSVMQTDPGRERYVEVRWCGGYQLHVPEQERSETSVRYRCGPDVVVELHSHGRMEPYFSNTDNSDEQGLRVYGVIGQMDRLPRVRMRVGVYGHFQEVPWSDVFSGELRYAVDDYENGEEDEIQYPETGSGGEPGSDWLRWYRRIRGGRSVPASRNG